MDYVKWNIICMLLNRINFVITKLLIKHNHFSLLFVWKKYYISIIKVFINEINDKNISYDLDK